jgi:hypothetical protein
VHVCVCVCVCVCVSVWCECLCVCVRASVALSEINAAANKLVFFGFSLFINRLIPPPRGVFSEFSSLFLETPPPNQHAME